MSLQRIDLTTALRPSLLPDETLLFVQDAVGLYEGYVLRLDRNAAGLCYPQTQSMCSVPIDAVLELTLLRCLVANIRFQIAKTDMRT